MREAGGSPALFRNCVGSRSVASLSRGHGPARNSVRVLVYFLKPCAIESIAAGKELALVCRENGGSLGQSLHTCGLFVSFLAGQEEILASQREER